MAVGPPGPPTPVLDWVYSLTKPGGGGSSSLLTQRVGTLHSVQIFPFPPAGEPAQWGNYTSPAHCAALTLCLPHVPVTQQPWAPSIQFVPPFFPSILHSANIPALSVLGAGDTNWHRTYPLPSESTKLAHTSCPPLSCSSGSDTGQAPRKVTSPGSSGLGRES